MKIAESSHDPPGLELEQWPGESVEDWKDRCRIRWMDRQAWLSGQLQLGAVVEAEPAWDGPLTSPEPSEGHAFNRDMELLSWNRRRQLYRQAWASGLERPALEPAYGAEFVAAQNALRTHAASRAPSDMPMRPDFEALAHIADPVAYVQGNLWPLGPRGEPVPWTVQARINCLNAAFRGWLKYPWVQDRMAEAQNMIYERFGKTEGPF